MVEKLIQKIAVELDREKIPYMIIGGQAVLLYGSPRLTRDIDITIGIDTDQFFIIENLCRKLKLKILSKNPQRFAQDTHVLPAEAMALKIRVDFIFSFTPYEIQAMAKTKKVRMGHYLVKFASVEDVIIHKLFAGRAIDLEDVKNICALHAKHLDKKYLKRWLVQFDELAGHKGLVKAFNRIMKNT